MSTKSKAFRRFAQKAGPADRSIRKTVAILGLASLLLVRTVAASGTDKTPATNKYLPFGPQDVYSTQFQWSAFYDHSEDWSQYTQIAETYLVDTTDRIFFTRFSLNTDSTTFSSTCSDAIRWSKTNWASQTLLADPTQSADQVKVIEKKDYGIAGFEFWTSTDMTGLDGTCMPTGADEQPTTTNLSFAGIDTIQLYFYFDDSTGATTPRQPRLRAGSVQEKTLSGPVMISLGPPTSNFTQRLQESGKDFASSFYKVEFNDPSSNWYQHIKMLGTQAAYDQSNQYILQLGFYYQLRSGSTTINHCTGQFVEASIRLGVTNTSQNLVVISSASQVITVPLSQSAMQQLPPTIGGFGCKLFTPTITWSTDLSPSIDVKIKTKHFTGENLVIEVQTQGAIADCTFVKVYAKVQPLAFSSADDYEDLTIQMTNLFLILSGAHGTLHSLSIKPENYPSDSKVTITLQLPINSSTQSVTFKNAAGTADVPHLKPWFRKNAGDSEKEIQSSNCACWWGVDALPSPELMFDFEPSMQSSAISGIKFTQANALTAGTYILKIKYHLQTGTGSSPTDFTTSSEFSIEVTVNDSSCAAVKYSLSPSLSTNYDIDYDPSFPEVSLPVGFGFKFMKNDGTTEDTRTCLNSLKSNIRWTVKSNSPKIEIDYSKQASAPTKIAPKWLQYAQSILGEKYTVEFELYDSSVTPTLLHSESITLTLRCTFTNMHTANIITDPPPSQTYTMGDSPLVVTFDLFQIGFCNLTEYSATYKTTSGQSLSPSSFTFNSSNQKFTISGASDEFDVIPCGSDSIDVVIEVTGIANPTLNTTMQFLVTLYSSAAEGTNPKCKSTYLEDSFTSKPYFEAFGGETQSSPLEIELEANQTRAEFDLGLLVYKGNPADKLTVTNPSNAGLGFTKIVSYSGGSYSIVLDFSLGGKEDFTYSINVTVSILQAVNLETRKETIEVKFIIKKIQADEESSTAEVSSASNETSANDANQTTQSSSDLNSTEDDSINISEDLEAGIQSPLKQGWQLPPQAYEYNDQIEKPSISKVTQTGELKIKFDSLRPIESEQDWEMSQKRQLRDKDVNRASLESAGVERVYAPEKFGRDPPGFQMYIEPYEMSDAKKLNFKYIVKIFDEESLQLELEFDTTEVVSTNPEPDYIVIEMKDFRDPENKLIVAEHEMRQPLPSQIDKGTAQKVELAGTVLGASVGTSFSFNVIINLLVSQSLSQMLGSIKNLQVIVHLTLVNVIIPANAMIFFSMIFQIISFDPIDIKEYVVDIFEVDGDAAPHYISPNFALLGYSSSFLIINLGSQVIFWCIEFAQIPYYSLLYLIGLRWCKQKKCNKKSKEKLRSIFWNQLLTLVDGTFLVIIIMAVINVREQINGFVELNSSYWISIIVIAGCLLEIICVSFFVFPKDKRELNLQRNKNKCGYIYEELHYKIQGKWALAYPILSQLRFLLIAYATIYLRNQMVIQVLLISVMTIFVMTLIGFVKPEGEPLSHLIDEFVVIIVLDLLFFSTDPVLDADMRIYLGWVLISILGLSILVNQGQLLVQSVIKLKNLCKRKWQMFWRKKAMKKNGRQKESQVDKEMGEISLSLNEQKNADGRRRRRMMPRQRQSRNRPNYSADDTCLEIQDLNVSGTNLAMPLPEIKEEEDDAISRSNVSKLSKRRHQKNDDDDASYQGSVQSQCEWCNMREDGTKCIDCEIRDAAENKASSNSARSKGKEILAQDELQISEIENEIAESEKQPKLFSTGKLLKTERILP